MLKLIKSIFHKEQTKVKEVVELIDYAEMARKEREQAKTKWEADNELKKKRDACYLNTTKTAFYGTYDEFISKQAEDRLRAFVPSSAMMNAQMQSMQGSFMGNNCYRGGSNPLSGLF